MSQLQVTGEAKIRDIQGPVVANDGVITALDGAASQYVRGDGTLADFPTSSGGGSSVSYYLNSSVSQGTIGGVAYRELSKEPIIGTGTDIAISSNGYVANYLTDANDPDVLSIPGGNFNCEFYFSVNNNTGNPFTYAELYKYDGTTFTLLGSSVGVPEYINQGTIIAPYYFAIPVPTSALALTDRLAIRIYVNVDGRTVTLHTENGHLCQVVTTLSKGMVSLNNLTDQSQFLTTGTSGTNFAIVSSGDTHTFNLPIASASNTGKLSSTDWSTFNNKQNALTNPITGTGASGNVAYFDGTTSITAENSFNYDASNNRLGVNTTVPNATIGANAGTDSGYSLLLKNDNANYNGIGFGTDSTYGNLIATEKLGTAPARNLTFLNQSGYISITEVGNLGVNILNPNTGLDIYNGTSAYLWLHTANSGITGTDGVRLALFSNNGANLRNFEGAMSITSEGDFQVITLGAENIRVNSADGKVGIGAPATVPEMLTVNGSIQQSGVLSSLLKTNGSGKLIAAVAGTDYVIPSALSGYVPTSRELTINGTTYDLSANRSWTITSDITGSGADGRVAYWNGTNSITSEAGFIYDASTNRLGVNTSVPNATIGADAALNSGYGLLVKTGSSNYNGIGIAIDSTYGNTIEAARLGSAPSRNLTLLNVSGYVSLTETGNFGVGILTPNNGIDIYNSTQSQLWLHNAASGITGTDGVRLALFNNLSANLRNFDGGLSLTAEGDFSIITIGAENIRVNSANGFVGIGNPTTLTNLLTVNGSASVNSNLDIRKSSGLATLNFPFTIGQNDPAFIQHDESTVNTGIMRFSVGDDDLANDYFVFGNTSSGFVERFKITATGIVTLGTWQGSAIADAYISSASTWNAKQNQLNGTGFVKASGTTISYDNSTYLTTSAASSTYLALTGGTLTGALNGTSASFSSTLTAGDATFINVAPILAIQSNTTGNIFLRFRQSADTMASMFYTNATATFTMSNNMGGLRFNTSGTSDAMTITSVGNVGINSTTPTDFIDASLGMAIMSTSGRSGLTLGSTQGTADEVLGRLSFTNTNSSNAGSKRLAYISGVRGTTNNSAYLEFGTADNTLGSQKMILTQSGGLLIGLTNEVYKLTVANNGLSGFIGATNQAGGTGDRFIRMGFGTAHTYAQIQGTRLNVADDINISMQPGGGNVLIAATSTGPYFDGKLSAYGAGTVPAACFKNDGNGQFTSSFWSVANGGGTQTLLQFVWGTGYSVVGNITSNGSIVSYNVTSDYRLKQDLKDYKGLELISAIKTYDYEWKSDKSRMYGVVAHELQEIIPYAVQGKKDEIDENGKEKMQCVDYTKIIPILVKAIQEQQEQINQLKLLINK
jgi:hypothetical protein